MKAIVYVITTVKVQLELKNGDSEPIGEIKKLAKEAAIKLVKVGLFHANKENREWNDPKIVNDGRDVPVEAAVTGDIVLSGQS